MTLSFSFLKEMSEKEHLMLGFWDDNKYFKNNHR